MALILSQGRKVQDFQEVRFNRLKVELWYRPWTQTIQNSNLYNPISLHSVYRKKRGLMDKLKIEYVDINSIKSYKEVL